MQSYGCSSYPPESSHMTTGQLSCSMTDRTMDNTLSAESLYLRECDSLSFTRFIASSLLQPFWSVISPPRDCLFIVMQKLLEHQRNGTIAKGLVSSAHINGSLQLFDISAETAMHRIWFPSGQNYFSPSQKDTSASSLCFKFYYISVCNLMEL